MYISKDIAITMKGDREVSYSLKKGQKLNSIVAFTEQPYITQPEYYITKFQSNILRRKWHYVHEESHCQPAFSSSPPPQHAEEVQALSGDFNGKSKRDLSVPKRPAFIINQ